MIGRVGVCSWSLQATAPDDLAEKLSRAGAAGVQIALDPLRTGAWGVGATVRALEAAGVTMLSGMMATRGEDYSTLETIRVTGGLRPDEHWAENLKAAEHDARLAGELGLRIVTFHAGFLPHDRSDPERAVMMERLGKVIRVFAARGVSVGFETGQETAGTLLEALSELPGAAVNFDPANMILYGMGDPGEAMRKLSARIIQAHVKDALPTEVPGTWGTEVPAGMGKVDWKAFFSTVRTCERAIDLLVEREAGDDRIADIRTALALIAEHVQ